MGPTALDGWGTALFFSVVWVALNQYFIVQRPAKRQLRNNLAAILVEMNANYRALARRQMIFASTMTFVAFDSCGPQIIGAIDTDAALNLYALYRDMRLLLSHTREDSNLCEKLDVCGEWPDHELSNFLQSVEGLNLHLEPQIKAVREAFGMAYTPKRPVQLTSIVRDQSSAR